MSRFYLTRIAKHLRQTGQPDMARRITTRRCGDCRACCTVKSVKADDGTPLTKVFEHCAHECEMGCSIYADKPVACSTYYCAWRLGYGTWEDRPDRAGVIVDGDAIGGGQTGGLTVRPWRPFDAERVARMCHAFMRVFPDFTHATAAGPWDENAMLPYVNDLPRLIEQLRAIDARLRSEGLEYPPG